jgi:hypothetical protein
VEIHANTFVVVLLQFGWCSVQGVWAIVVLYQSPAKHIARDSILHLLHAICKTCGVSSIGTRCCIRFWDCSCADCNWDGIQTGLPRQR